MTKDIEETRELNSKKKQIEDAVEDLMAVMGKREVHIGISALMSYMCTLAYHNGYPVEKMVEYMAGLYQMHRENNQ